MRSILLKGGDTDTNAAIVGGLLGARWGLSGIPKSWRKNGVRFDNYRKSFIKLKNVDELLDLVKNLLKVTPKASTR